MNATLKSVGDWLGHHQPSIRRVQWGIIAAYILLVTAPAFLPLPPDTAHLWSNLTLFAQFVFWGIWWPFVLLSMILVGRAWCGFFCPEGALTEMASRFSAGRAVPRWLTWPGWPFVAFACTTIYGQMVSVYQYPKPVLVILGGSTLAAIVIGLNYGREKRVWCRYMCPVNGVFGLLSKLAPFHFRVDPARWNAATHEDMHNAPSPNCAPLVPIRTMKGNSSCHMCGRCSGFRDAVELSARSPNAEIVSVAGRETDPWQTVLILFGMLGIAAGAFHWSGSSIYIDLKLWLAEKLIEAGMTWPLDASMPWWILTNYAEHADVMSVLDGFVLLVYIGGFAIALGSIVSLFLAAAIGMAGPFIWQRFHHLAQALIPLAGAGVFLGLSALTVTMLKSEGIGTEWVAYARGAVLTGASVWSLVLCWSILGKYAGRARRVAALLICLGAIAFVDWGWFTLFWA